MNVIGLDIGGTKIFAGRYTAKISLEEHIKLKTEAAQGKDTVLTNIVEAINAVRNNETQAIGIAWAGFVNGETGQIIKAPNISALDGFALTEFITEKTGLPAVLENDARCFTLGEYLTCDPKPKSCLGIILGTGVGSGLIINGEIFQGGNFSAGEIGHISINGAEVEDQIAGPGLQKRFEVERLSDITSLTPEELTPVLNTLIDWMYTLLLAYDPDKIIIGGGAGKHFWKAHKSQIENLLNKKSEQYPITFTLEFTERKNAGAEGAAYLAHQKL